MEITRHFTATTYVVHRDKVLLHWHKKLDCWLPPGGHIDRDELPAAAAVREVREETGLEIELYLPDQPLYFEGDSTCQLARPAHLLLEDINPYHQHIDFIYYATAVTDRVKPKFGETDQLRWFTASELEQTFMPVNVKVCAREALALLAES